MSQFGYVVALDLHGRRAVLVGGGREAVARLDALLAAGARVALVTSRQSPALADAVAAALTVDPDSVEVHARPYRDGDLADAAIAICTGEDPDSDVAAFWSESRRRHVLASVLDDIPRTDFAQPALVRRGDLRVAISTGGAAPALARRYREDLEAHWGPAHGDLLDAASRARERAGRRPVSFEEWAGRWSDAVADLHGLADLVATDGIPAVADRIVATLLPDAAATGPTIEATVAPSVAARDDVADQDPGEVAA